MIFTNRDQRDQRKYIFQASDVSDLIENAVTPGRIRQISRGSHIGWLQFKAVVPDDAVFPFPPNHRYTQADVEKVCAWIAERRKTDQNYRLKLDRWYSEADIRKILTNSTRLNKKRKNGELLKTEKPAAVLAAPRIRR